MTVALEALLSEGAVNCGFYWRGENHTGSIQVWEDAATRDPVYAAVSAKDEDEERRKTAGTVEVLKRSLNDGVCLDIGCGYGRIAKYLLPNRRLAGYIGVDGSVTMLRFFSDRHTNSDQEKRTPLLLINADIDEVLLNDRSVDNVIIAAVFLHNPKSVIQKSIDEIYRVMKPGAKLFVFSSFPNRCSLRGLQGVLYLWALRLLGQGARNGPIRFFSASEVKHLFRNFKETEIYPVGFSMMPKSLVIFPKSWGPFYRGAVYPRLESLARLVLPGELKRPFCAHYDIIAYK